MKPTMFLFFLIYTCIMATGCLYIPTGEGKVLAGEPVTDEQLAFLDEHGTDKDMVLNNLGEPDLIWEDACVFSYNWDVRQGVLIWAIAGGYTAAGGYNTIPKKYALLVQFDEHDHVLRHEKVTRSSFTEYGDFLNAWVNESDRICNPASMQ